MAIRKENRKARYERFDAAFAKADAEGREAALEAMPTPMVVYEADPLSGERLPNGKEWLVNEGPCGFAWINVTPGNSSFAHWLVKHDLVRKAYRGGVDVWVHQFGQSYERKMAYARKFAQVLSMELSGERLIIYASGRLD